MRASIVGASGYIGGELLRLLLGHPQMQVHQVTSQNYAGRYVHSLHPNLRKATRLKFTRLEELEACDLLFLALPHGQAMHRMESFLTLAERVVDTSADFRLRDAEDYPLWYGGEHASPEQLPRFVYGLPELHREEIRGAKFVSGTGCLAAAAILGLAPIVKYHLVDLQQPIVIEGKIGSSAAGNRPDLSSHHPERSGAVRSFRPTGHRHTVEMLQELSFGAQPRIHFSATSIEMVRGILTTAHAFLAEDMTDRELWRVYRKEYGEEPFVRIVKERRGVYRYPEPKIVMGTNYCDVGFERDTGSRRVVVFAALDNLMKGGAGGAVQCMNLMCGFPERMGLEFAGLHPV
jgi:N-acetyl-gamma-glutamyl-phosphate/LysW-gamma-L-alpha-aminoadipyl-6-phosphate reductase